MTKSRDRSRRAPCTRGSGKRRRSRRAELRRSLESPSEGKARVLVSVISAGAGAHVLHAVDRVESGRYAGHFCEVKDLDGARRVCWIDAGAADEAIEPERAQ